MKHKTTNKNNHPDRVELFKAIKTKSKNVADHISWCEDCKDIFDILTLTVDQKELIDWSACEELTNKCSQIPKLISSRNPVNRITGSIKYDSWSQLQSAQLRDAAQGLERRFLLTGGIISLELVAERRPDGWDFTARVYKHKKPISSQFILKAARQTVFVNTTDGFSWFSHRPPKMIQLCSPEMQISFKGLIWS